MVVEVRTGTLPSVGAAVATVLVIVRIALVGVIVEICLGSCSRVLLGHPWVVWRRGCDYIVVERKAKEIASIKRLTCF